MSEAWLTNNVRCGELATLLLLQTTAGAVMNAESVVTSLKAPHFDSVAKGFSREGKKILRYRTNRRIALD